MTPRDLIGDFKPVTDITETGQPVAKKNDKILLVDADTIAYTSALRAVIEEPLLSKEFYSDVEWTELMASGKYDEKTSILKTLDMEQAQEEFIRKLDRIKALTGCEEVQLHFSEGKENFRFTLEPNYKANRDPSVVPPSLQELKHSLINLDIGACYYHKVVEADDVVVGLYKSNPGRFVLCAIDKDVLNSCVGRHFNYYESTHFNKDMKWQETDKFTAFIWPFKQAIMGDKSDGIEGIKGMGPKKTDKFLSTIVSEQDYHSFDFYEITNVLHKAIVALYRKNNLSMTDYLRNFNLVSMDHLNFNLAKPYEALFLLQYEEKDDEFVWVSHNMNEFLNKGGEL